jgi:RNA polymerase sigma-70 factor (ECF subfamily)
VLQVSVTDPTVKEAPQAPPAESLDALSDQELARRARHDRQAFGVLYERHVAAIYRYVFYRVGNVEDAEDLTARVFARALRHIHKYDDRGVPFTAWLYRIAHNAVANFHRDNSRRPSVPLEEADALGGAGSDDDYEQRIDREQARARLLRAVRKLPPERQHLLVLKFVEQLQNAEIGQIMNRSEGAIKSLYHRTLLQLRKIMGELEP